MQSAMPVRRTVSTQHKNWWMRGRAEEIPRQPVHRSAHQTGVQAYHSIANKHS